MITRGTPAWRYFGDFRAVVLAGQVLVLQVAHPVVAAGVRDHSDYTEDPWTRLMRTGASLSIYVYGGPDGAKFEARRLWELHRRFTGVGEDGRRYSALDPRAYAWVHATLVQVAVDAQELFGRGMRPDELDQYYAQMREVGLMLGVEDQHLPPDWPAFRCYYDKMVDSFGPNRTIDTLLRTIHTVPKPVRWLPDSTWPWLRERQARLQLFLIAATLPPRLRERLGLDWTPLQERRFRRFRRAVRLFATLVPPPLRTVHMRAVARLNVWYRRRKGLS
ncbi:oxygenase MpaB family protein [Amycolatopsis sp. GM8]|uniref:oxygenase MpaB family protein n=1 Tax=Amycolatopsis sp. GM8 TaxID=2896530 RepID=UPI001F4722A0|nr:oxygenase MpaB family protein [Amycolatopsis sp. GM8]